MRLGFVGVTVGLLLVLSMSLPTIATQPMGRHWQASSEWTNVTPVVSPPAMAGAVMAYSSRANRFVLFGGWDGTALGETWVLDPAGPEWHNLATTGSPAPRGDAAFAYDAREDVFVLFGGWYDSPPEVYHRLGDTWHFSLNNVTWTQVLTPISPSPRSDSAIANHPVDGELILFGGFDGSNYLGDTWRYDAQSRRWSEANPALEPPPRADGRMAYEPQRERIILFGGNDFSGPDFTFHHLDDTWTFTSSSNTWVQIFPLNHPSARDYAVFAYDDATGEFLLHGGYGERVILGDLWAFDVELDTWIDVPVVSGPEPRFAAVGGYSSEDDIFVLSGGLGPSGLLADTWFLRYSGAGTGGIVTPTGLVSLVIAFAVVSGVSGTVIVLAVRRRRRKRNSPNYVRTTPVLETGPDHNEQPSSRTSADLDDGDGELGRSR